MKKIGVIGGECSLAEYFAWFFNEKNDKGEYNVPDYRVTAISGYYKKENLAIAGKFNVDKVYDDFTEMAGEVDAVMITARDGKYHYGFAKPFLENKTPLYIFKPVTTDYAQAKELISVAKKNNTLVCRRCDRPDLAMLFLKVNSA